MKKKWILIILIGLIALGAGLFGYQQDRKPDQALARINNYSMSVKDFENELEYTGYGIDTSADPRYIMDVIIDEQLLVQEAQRQGLHKRKSFLITIEHYWKQTLIKELMDKETQRIQKELAPADQEKAFQDWLDKLRSKAHIQINQELLEKTIKDKFQKTIQ
ncbi:MAG: hypothetical protein P9M07_02755 [Candidatus Aceula meridiana]|nr:hypothetical protein [Candidatus Aceula meridiana]